HLALHLGHQDHLAAPAAGQQPRPQVVGAGVAPEGEGEGRVLGVDVQEHGEGVAQQQRGDVDPAQEARFVPGERAPDPEQDEGVQQEGEGRGDEGVLEARHREARRLPRARCSTSVARKVRTASPGVQTMGSWTLKEVLSSTGTPVRFSNSWISRQYLGFVARSTSCGRAVPSTWTTAGISERRSASTGNTVIMNGASRARPK